MKKNDVSAFLPHRQELLKTLMIMKFVALFLLLATLQTFGKGYSQTTRLSLDMKDVSVADIFDVIEEQSEFKFLYHDDLITDGHTVNIDIEDGTIEEILEELFSESNTTYSVLENNLVVITPKNEEQNEIVVSGTVTNSNGEPLAGVNILIKGTTIGTLSGYDGTFELTVPSADAILVFSYMGFVTEEIPVGNQREFSIILIESLESLDEVVVIGYGSVKKKELTGSVATLKEDDFNKGAVTDALQLIQGKVAGLSITKKEGGDPTEGYEITLRGGSSIHGSLDPLVVIDGIPGGELSMIAPEDIESIDVLKDGSAAAIYGTRATNGVILITTKKGHKGAMQVEYSSRYYTEQIVRQHEVLSGSQYLELKDRLANSGVDVLIERADEMVDYGASTDWLDEITRTPFSHNQHLSLSGGSENTSYRISFDYFDQQGVLLTSGKEEYRLGFNMQQMALNDKMRFNVQAGVSDNKVHPVDYNTVRQAIKRNPTEPVYDENGELFEQENEWQYENPVGLLTERTRDDAASRLYGNLGVDAYIMPDLKLNLVGGMQIYRELNGYYIPSYALPMENQGTKGNANRESKAEFLRTFETTLEWKKQSTKHFFTLLAGYSYQDYTEEGFFASNSGFITDDVLYNNLGLGTYLNDPEVTAEMTSFKNESLLAGFFGRIAYSFNNKYFLSASVRHEGSSKFGKNYRWGTFPAISAAWDLSQEAFMDDVSFINYLKLRAGYGITGNQGLVDERNDNDQWEDEIKEFYIPITRYDSDADFFYIDKFIPGYSPVSNPNPNFKWETKAEVNIGIDWLVLNSRLGGSIDYYIRDTRDLVELYDVPSPPNLYTSTWANVGTMRNTGIEFTLNAAPVVQGDFKWKFVLIVDKRNSKVMTLHNEFYSLEYRNVGWLGAPGISTTTHRYEEGEPIGNIYAYQFEEINDEGLWVFSDLDTSGTSNDEDKTVIGNGVPDWYLGFTNTFTYKNFDLTIVLRGMFGHQIINAKRIWHENPIFLPGNILTSGMDSRLTDSPVFSSYYVEDGDFVKVDNITLGYTKYFKDKQWLKSFRIYTTVNSAFVFTKYTGMDPEVSFNRLDPGNDDRFDYPSTRTFIVGVNVKF